MFKFLCDFICGLISVWFYINNKVQSRDLLCNQSQRMKGWRHNCIGRHDFLEEGKKIEKTKNI